MVEPFYADPWLTVFGGDCRDVLRELPAESVHCVVTSPPYWGLRDYGTATWEGGDEGCAHAGSIQRTMPPGSEKQASSRGSLDVRSGDCACGARRIDSQLGLEQTPEEYVRAMVDVFREVRRVLRDDGTVWLNLGDSYASTPPGNGKGFTPETTGLHGGRNSSRYQQTMDSGAGTKRNTVVAGFKPKDLVGIPWRVAFALQADGWYLRSDIIWSKPNPMPESVTDRPTKSHEYLFLLAKSARYYFDADAVREAVEPSTLERNGYRRTGYAKEAEAGSTVNYLNPNTTERWTGTGRNIRSVWTIATAPYPGAHFATFPPKLVEPCVKAGTSERGVCPECGAPWERVVLRSTATPGQRPGYLAGTGVRNDGERAGHFIDARSETTGWRPSCEHEAEPVPAVVLDPFAGTGTVGMVAQSLSRRAVLIDLNPDYLRQCLERNRDMPLGLAVG